MLLQFGFYFQYVGRTWLGFILLFELISFYTRRIIFSFFFCSPWFLLLFIKEKNNRTMWRTSNKYSCPIFYFLAIFIFITLIRPSVFSFFLFPIISGQVALKKKQKKTPTKPACRQAGITSPDIASLIGTGLYFRLVPLLSIVLLWWRASVAWWCTPFG